MSPNSAPPVSLVHIPTAVPHPFDDQGHLSLAVDHFGDILHELIGAKAADDAHG